jgi:hypothetical protein
MLNKNQYLSPDNNVIEIFLKHENRLKVDLRAKSLVLKLFD